MKNIKYFLLIIIFSLGMVSCDEWLEIEPKSEIHADKLFETQAGFKDALIGIYIGMSSKESYGQYLTWHITEDLARQYAEVSRGNYRDIVNYDYENVNASNILDRIWLKQYNIIAEINKLLEALEEKGSIFHPAVFNIMKGEALALRAYCHFDLLRMYGYGNLENREELFSKKTIPYITVHSKEVEKQRTYTETFVLLEKDIEEALKCLEYDTMYVKEDVERDDEYNEAMSFFRESSKGRKERLNYAAAKALQTRVYMWQGKKAEALEAAEEVISYFEKYRSRGQMSWASESRDVFSTSESSRDCVFYKELLFSLDVNNLGDNITPFYQSHIGSGWNSDRLKHSSSFVRNLFNTSSEGKSDLRYIKQYERSGSDYLTTKLRKTTIDNSGSYSDIVPMIRISEMYLIAAECYATSVTDKNLSKAIEYLNLLKEKRKILDTYYLASNTTQEDVEKAIFLEYRREFIQEGQLFYFYKRKATENFPGLSSSFIMTDKEYVIPYPKIELDFGNRVQE